MTQREEIKAKADKLGQIYFPDECNVWARENIEAKVCFICVYRNCRMDAEKDD